MSKAKKPLRKRKRVSLAQLLFIVISLVVIFAITGLVVYFLYNGSHQLPVNKTAYDEITSSSQVRFFDRQSYYAIEPANGQIRAGIVVYPGAFSSAQAYLSPYGALAKFGIAVYVVRPRLGFALFDTNRAERIVRENISVSNWYVAGHSLGGVAACEFAKTKSVPLRGLILLASYCSGDASKLGMPVLSIYGSEDGLATPAKVLQSQKNLPAGSQTVEIPGLNHTGFGSFARLQAGDNYATRTEAAMQAEIINEIERFVSKNNRAE